MLWRRNTYLEELDIRPAIGASSYHYIRIMMIFSSDRLSFGLWTAASARDLAVINELPDVMRYFPRTYASSETLAFAEKQNQQYHQCGYCYYSVSLLSAPDRCIGFIGLSYQAYDSPFTPAVDIGWRLHPDYWGQGLATEGAKACLQQGTADLGLGTIIAVCPQANLVSQRVMVKAGMSWQGVFDHPALVDYPELRSCCCYTYMG